jgi:hypothetical protein
MSRDGRWVEQKTASGSPTGGIVYNSYVRSTTNYFDSWNFSLENSSIEVNLKNTPANGLTIISSGVNLVVISFCTQMVFMNPDLFQN